MSITLHNCEEAREGILTYEHVMSRISMSHVSHTSTRYIGKKAREVLLHDMYVRHVAHIDESRVTHQSVKSSPKNIKHISCCKVVEKQEKRFSRVIESCHTYQWIMSRINVSGPNNTGWRRPIGCLKLQVIFRKRTTNSRALLRKVTYEDKASYDSTPPCIIHTSRAAKSWRSKRSTSWVMSHISMNHVTYQCVMTHEYQITSRAAKW